MKENKNLPIIFVVGNSRSGTTMMGRILGKHSLIFTFDELHFFGQLWSKEDENKNISKEDAKKLASKLLCIQRKGYLANCKYEEFENEGKIIVESIKSEKLTSLNVFKAFLFYEANLHNKKIPCDQTPRNVLYLEEILKNIPNAKIINMIRDPRDVLLSQKNKWKRKFLGAKNIPLKESIRSWINYHPITISKLWNAAISAADKFKNNPNVLTIYFENLIQFPEENIKKICEFLEIEFEESMLKVPQIGSSTGKDKPNVLGIDKNKAGSWRKGGISNTEIYLLQKISGNLMKKHGYKLEEIKPNKLKLIYFYITLPVKLITAFILNLKRMKNIKENIKKRLT